MLSEDHPAYKLTGKYLSPFSTLGFRKIFCNNELLVSFLGHILQRKPIGGRLNCFYTRARIQSGKEEPSAFFDLYNNIGEGERFMIEMQDEYQPDIIARTLEYMPYLLTNNAPPEFDYRLNDSCLIEILNFSLDEREQYLKKFRLNHKNCWNKPMVIFLEMPKFKKKEHELVSGLDKVLYALKNLHRFKERPEVLFEDEFKLLFDRAAVANLTAEELQHLSLRING